MKKVHIIAIAIIAVTMGVIISAIWDAAEYASFARAAASPEREYHVVGTLNKNKKTIYKPEENPNLMTFWMYDRDSAEHKVVLNRPKPQDFEKSEQVVVVGTMDGDKFLANDILMKCPSKYNEENKVETPQGKEKISQNEVAPPY